MVTTIANVNGNTTYNKPTNENKEFKNTSIEEIVYERCSTTRELEKIF